MEDKKVILIIMDGWGLGKVAKSDAIQHAKTPFVSSLYSKYPHTTLVTCGEDVGLPVGQMGNSEVGHLNLGAGRIVYQELQRINVAIRTGEFAKNEVLLNSIKYARDNNKPLHLVGLISDGGVHSHLNHVKAITSLCKAERLSNVLIHAFTDGRDTDPKSGLGFLTDLQNHLNTTVGKIATITGRYYAMDRDKRWERIKLAYDALVNGIGSNTSNMLAAVEQSYEDGVTDEFIKPIINAGIQNQEFSIRYQEASIQNQASSIPYRASSIKAGDAVICFNFRTDRCREITEVLTQTDMPEFDMKKLDLHYTTMTQYDHKFKNVKVVFENDDLKNTLGEVLQQNNKTQIRIAETEKYPHVSFFFSGGREVPFEGEKRIMVQSLKVATYDLQPEMSAFEVTDKIVAEIERNSKLLNSENPPLGGGGGDFICLNFANADMVGHTGVWEAIIKAVETVDQCVEKVVTAALQNNYTVFLTADHGNADYAINEDGTPNTAHTLNLVPLFLIDNDWRGNIKPGKLGDIAPTILTVMGLPIPKEMSGNILIN